MLTELSYKRKSISSLMRILLIFILCLVNVISPVAQDVDEDKSILLSPEDFYIAIKSTDVPLIIDVRTWKEYRKDRIPGARLTETSTILKTVVDSVDVDQAIFVYCDDNQRSTAACSLLRDWGYTKVFELAGGMIAWKLASYEIDAEKIKTSD
jgi:rhodanese-related sulfurtransferase